MELFYFETITLILQKYYNVSYIQILNNFKKQGKTVDFVI